MAKQSWHDTKLYKSSRRSGSRFETVVVEMVQRYTSHVWRNVRVETLLTQTGSTELDIVFYANGVLYVLELKRVRRIIGDYGGKRWTMYGWLDHIDETSEYVIPNVIEQNNIHARSLMDLYYSEFKCFPVVCPFVIVPDDCEIPVGLRNDVFTVQALEEYLRARHAVGNEKVAYRAGFLLSGSSGFAPRSDFVSRGVREGQALRGRRRI